MTPALPPSPALREALCRDGVLTAAINRGNPVLVQGHRDEPTGVAVDIAREVARRLGVPLAMHVVDAARDSYAALVAGRADLGFLAIEPAREEGVCFTRPYVEIEGVFAVRPGGPVDRVDRVDAAGVTVAARRGSAYDLYLTRTLEHAEIVRGDEAIDVFVRDGLDVLSGVRQPMEELAVQHGLDVLEPAFQAIRQAVALPLWCREAVGEVDALVGELVTSGFVAASLARAGQVAAVPRQQDPAQRGSAASGRAASACRRM